MPDRWTQFVTDDGWVVDVNTTNEVIDHIDNLAGASNSWQARVSLRSQARISGTGAAPIQDAGGQTLGAVLGAPIPPVSQLREDAPPMLDLVCRRALARDRDKRFTTAAEFLAALTRYLYTVDPPVTNSDVATVVAELCPARPRRFRPRRSP